MSEEEDFKQSVGKMKLSSYFSLLSNFIVAGCLWFFQDHIFSDDNHFWRNFFVGLFIVAGVLTFVGNMLMHKFFKTFADMPLEEDEEEDNSNY